MTPLKNQAIQAALMGNWEAAILANLELLKSDPADIDTLNRIGFAYSIIGHTKNAKDAYKKVLELDIKNPIALKNLKRLAESIKTTDESPKNNGQSAPLAYNAGFTNNMFLEENGKTKIMELVNLADNKTIARLRTGETVAIQVKRSKIYVLDNDRQYIGMLPDDIAKRLIKLLEGGNKYECYIKALQNNKISIFIKETKRAPRFKNQPSFTTLSKKAVLEGGSKNYRFPKRDDADAEED